MKFLDPYKTIFTCKRESCEDCDVKSDVTCHFSQSHLVKFILTALPAFIIGGVGSFLYKWWAFVIFFASLPLYFGLLEIRVMCSHCPHYAEPETKTLTCWANYGSPKIWKYHPGPMSFWEKALFFIGMAVVVFSPVLFMILGKYYILLAVYLVLVLFGIAMLFTFLCTRCMNFACPFNRVKKDVRERFFGHNPKVKEAWEKDKKI